MVIFRIPVYSVTWFFLVFGYFPVEAAIMADRYSYLASAGFFLFVLSVDFCIWKKFKNKERVPVGFIIYTVIIVIITMMRISGSGMRVNFMDGCHSENILR